MGHQVAGHRYVEGVSAHKVPIDNVVGEPLQRMLTKRGIAALYGHQVQALTAIRKGQHTVVATPTASGKSLIYNLSLFECLVDDPHARGLYIYPLKALTQDQYKNFEQWALAASPLHATVAVYDGDTSAYHRKKIRQEPPSVIMTNPEMVHLALLPYHRQWGEFFENLNFVVIDEVHTYRGLLGCHMGQVLRRLQRICALYGADPIFIFTSATVANPGELAQQLCGLRVTTIQQKDTEKGARHQVLMNSDEGPAQTAILLLKAALARGLRTIVYTQSRKLAELIALWVRLRSGRWTDKISVYRAGLLPKERRSIEQRLQSGDLYAVVSTSALELGIDIGNLDICILVGYPGSMIATWQRSGRVGRKGQKAAVVMIAGQDALDQYYVSQPEAFFNGRAEKAVINPYNPVVQEPHLVCAASEQALHREEVWLQHQATAACVARLEHSGELLRSYDGETLHTLLKRPHRKVGLRAAGKRYLLLDGEQQVIGEINGYKLYREAHPGAVYIHQGISYLTGKVDEVAGSVAVEPAEISYYTRVRGDTDVDIIDTYNSINFDKTKIYIGKVKVIDQVTGYEKVHTTTGRKLGHVALDVPPVDFITDALWFEISDQICRQISESGFDLMGALHAAEHAAISIMPLLVLADRNDVGGLATPRHPQNSKATIFVYDGVPGGGGYSQSAYDNVLELLNTAATAIQRCSCDAGCPACVHSPKCGSGNQPMDKDGGHLLLRLLARPGKISDKVETRFQKTRPAVPQPPKPPFLRYGVFDLETQRSAKEVGGWHMAHRMKASCGVVYDSLDDRYSVYLEHQIEDLIMHLKQLDQVVGFNSKRFDYQVLSGYSDYDFTKLPSLDLLELVHSQLGFRLSLDRLAQETLRVGKSGSGLDALEWWQKGEIEKIIAYCRKDVKITRDLYRYARDKGYLVYCHKEGGRFRIPLNISRFDGSTAVKVNA